MKMNSKQHSKQNNCKIDPDKNPVFLMHAITHQLDDYADKMLQEKLSISYNKFLTLLAVYENQIEHGECSQKNISDFTRLTEASISRIVDDLILSNLLSKTINSSNRSKSTLSFTDAGNKLFLECFNMLEATSNQLLKSFDETEIASLNTLLHKIQNSIQNSI